MSNNKSLIQDSRDLYHRVLKWLMYPILAMHAFSFVARSHRVLDQASASNALQYKSSDVGLIMPIKELFPWMCLEAECPAGYRSERTDFSARSKLSVSFINKMISFDWSAMTHREDETHCDVDPAVFSPIPADIFGCCAGSSEWSLC